MTTLPRMTRRGLAVGAALVGATSLLPRAEAALPGRTVAARRKFFGEVVDRDGRVRPDRVAISWFGCTSYAVALAGRVFVLDAWVPRGSHSGYVPTDAEEVADLRPSHVFIGHGHFDHAADGGSIVARSGARVVGTREHVVLVRQQAGRPVRGLALGREADRHGTVHRFRAAGVEVTAIRHPHSEIKPPDLTDPHLPLLPLPDLSTQLEYPPDLQSILHLLGHARDPEGGAVIYQFRVPGFRLLWNDSVGPVEEEAPGVPRLLRRLPRSDVHLGAVQGFGQITNGMRDVRAYVEAAAARLFVPGHHDDWGLPVVATQADAYRAVLEAELARIPRERRPRLRWMSDPGDYLRPARLTFRV